MMDVVALGELLIDFTSVSYDVDGYPTMAAHPGGAPANFLAALAKFGAKTALLGKVGKDAFGNLLVQTLKNAGIEIKGIVMAEDVFTTLAFVTLDETGDREFSFARKPGADTCISFEELDMSLIDEAKVFHFGTLSLTNDPAKTATQKMDGFVSVHGFSYGGRYDECCADIYGCFPSAYADKGYGSISAFIGRLSRYLFRQQINPCQYGSG